MIGLYEVSSGGMSGTLADPKLIFSTALKCCASSIILSHNHPSGNLKPSQADIALTNKLKSAGSFLDIQGHDHIIITSEGYYSFADEGMIYGETLFFYKFGISSTVSRNFMFINVCILAIS